MDGKKILITGGAGFVGSNLVHELAHRYDCQLVVLDSLFSGCSKFLAEVRDRIHFVEGDVTDPDLTEPLVEKADVVFHLAGRNIIVSMDEPQEDLRVNAGGTLNLLLQARKHGVERFLYTSTSSIFGNPQQLPLSEDGEKNFLYPYAVSKFAAESYCRVFYKTYDVPTTIVRYSNVYGINQDPQGPYCGVISRLLQRALSQQPITIHGDGKQTRDFTYIGDAVEATIQAALSPKAVGQTYNTGTGKETSLNQLVLLIKEVVGVPQLEVRYVDRRAIDDIQRRVIDIERIRQDLHWTPAVSLREGLTRSTAWLRSLNRS